MTDANRLSTGIGRLDDMLGGGLIPGTLAVVLGATGIGKTQLGVAFANHGLQQEGERGLIFDMTSRGDSQNQAEYARRICDWVFAVRNPDERTAPEDVWDRDAIRRDYFHIFRRTGRRVTISDLEFEQWKEWKAELTKKLDQCIGFFYGNFVHGVRRCVIDGIEPTDRASDSFQMHVFDYIYHQILHKESDWVARDLFRVHFRVNAETVARHAYNHAEVGCLLLQTSHEVMLDQLLSRPIESGDVLSNANTVILMGKVRDGIRMTRALHVAKHRGSRCDDAIVPFDITEYGLRLET
ncbi:MAG: recombinase RecA [Planctomycetota bacterium]|nr:recombinase RecA [Planctomycetota bacterium]